ncbi:Lrp/AsnC family transcriptional regulator [Candidatus Woesearchaeota archaeon]|nr:Lrp/AsnC family transcriptional regulator [Candidatus Woesearchaeota archaeon]
MRVLTHKNPELILDTKDWRILQELIANVRQPISQIAKKCLLSRQSVEYRLKQLDENKLIIGSRTVVNNKKLGYKSYHIFLEVHTPQEEQKILERAEKALFCNAIIVYSGKYNLEISIMARDEAEFSKLYQELITDVRIRNDVVLVLLEGIKTEVLPKKCFPEMKEMKVKKFEKSIKKNKDQKQSIDQNDLIILHALSKDAQISNLTLAKKLDVSKDTIKYRITKLEHEGYIIQYRPVVNYSVLGFSINSLLIKTNHNPDAIKEFEAGIKKHDAVLWAAKTFGYYNYIVYAITKDLEEFHDVINGMKENFSNSIKTYEILFAFKELKYNFMADNMLEN